MTVPELGTTRRRTARHRGRALALAAAIVGTMLIPRTFGRNIALVDPLLGLIVVIGLGRVARRHGFAARLARASAVWMWLILAGSVLGLLGVGLTSWAIDALVRDFFCFGIFFAVVALVDGAPDVLRACLIATALSIAALALVVLAAGGDYRPAGTFENPNYTGHYLVLGAAVVYVARFLTVKSRTVLILFVALAIVRTGSFGAISMGLAGAIYLLSVGIRRHPSVGKRITLAFVLVALALTAWRAYGLLEGEQVSFGSTITSYRLTNSTNVRTELWLDALNLVPSFPLGVGPYGIYSRSLLGRGVEVHNDVIAYLVERGVVGLVGLLGLAFVTWRRFPSGGAFRLVMVMLAAGGLFRETLHFRHAWVFLGIAAGLDLVRPRRPARPARPIAQW